MIIVNFKLWYFVNVILPSLAIVLTVSITATSTTMLISYVIKRWIKRIREACNE